ncbi:MAG TPA: response regulator [Gaiellaceae bacterium]|nr:response regulator [Gaiellaceae bacterium]
MPRALIVEDDPALRLLSRVNLELDGFEVEDAATVAEAEAALAAAVPDVVLLDLHLGRSPSTGLLERLRSAGIPVAIVTGTDDLEALAGAADAVLAKPFAPEDLVSTARRLARVEP